MSAVTITPIPTTAPDRLTWFAELRQRIAEDVFTAGDYLVDEGWKPQNIAAVLEAAEAFFASQVAGVAEMASDTWFMTRTVAAS